MGVWPGAGLPNGLMGCSAACRRASQMPFITSPPMDTCGGKRVKGFLTVEDDGVLAFDYEEG